MFGIVKQTQAQQRRLQQDSRHLANGRTSKSTRVLLSTVQQHQTQHNYRGMTFDQGYRLGYLGQRKWHIDALPEVTPILEIGPVLLTGITSSLVSMGIIKTMGSQQSTSSSPPIQKNASKQNQKDQDRYGANYLRRGLIGGPQLLLQGLTPHAKLALLKTVTANFINRIASLNIQSWMGLSTDIKQLVLQNVMIQVVIDCCRQRAGYVPHSVRVKRQALMRLTYDVLQLLNDVQQKGVYTAEQAKEQVRCLQDIIQDSELVGGSRPSQTELDKGKERLVINQDGKLDKSQRVQAAGSMYSDTMFGIADGQGAGSWSGIENADQLSVEGEGKGPNAAVLGVNNMGEGKQSTQSSLELFNKEFDDLPEAKTKEIDGFWSCFQCKLQLYVSVVDAVLYSVQDQQDTPHQNLNQNKKNTGYSFAGASKDWQALNSEVSQLALDGLSEYGQSVLTDIGVCICEASVSCLLNDNSKSSIEAQNDADMQAFYMGKKSNLENQNSLEQTVTNANMFLKSQPTAAVNNELQTSNLSQSNAIVPSRQNLAGQGLSQGWLAEQNSPSSIRGALLPALKRTRRLERFRNRVGINKLFIQYIGEVLFMMDDIHTLWSLNKTGNIQTQRLTLDRREELNQLTGVRRFIAVMLEAIDVLAPLVQKLTHKLGTSLSYLLSQLVGKAVGLVYKGIKDGLGQSSSSQPSRGQNSTGQDVKSYT